MCWVRNSLKLCVLLLLYCNKIDLGLTKKTGNMARWTRGKVENISGEGNKESRGNRYDVCVTQVNDWVD